MERRVLVKHEISPLTECYVGCELPFPSDQAFCFLTIHPGSSGPSRPPSWAERRTQGQLGPPAASCQPSARLPGKPNLELIRKTGTTPTRALRRSAAARMICEAGLLRVVKDVTSCKLENTTTLLSGDALTVKSTFSSQRV